MKWETKSVNKKEAFTPFAVTLTFETHEEYVHFHDNVMTNLKPGAVSSPLYGSIFKYGNGEGVPASGEL